MVLLTEPKTATPLDPAEALIREARRRKRRRRALVAGVVLVVLAATVGYALSRAGGPPPPRPAVRPRPPAAPSPAVDTAAFAHQGTLAFVSQGDLWVLDGSTLRRVATGGLVPSSPSFSPDGRWLAFVATKEVTKRYTNRALGTYTETEYAELWLARADGTGARPAAGGLRIDKAFGWDPRRDLFAVSAGTATTAPFGLATGVDLVGPSGTQRALVRGTHVTSAAWSPDGSALAVSTQVASPGPGRGGAVLATYPIGGGSPVVWLRLDTQTANFAVLAGWWPGWGIGYTTVGEGAVPGGSGSADGSSFFAIAGPGAVSRLLGKTLQSEGAGAPTASRSGWLAFVADDGTFGRTVGQGEEVVVCSPAGSCTVVPHPATTVTVDPVWTPQGTTLDFVQGPVEQGSLPEPDVESWYDARQLSTYDPSTGVVAPGVPSPGVTVPQWSAAGRRLLYVADDGLWLRRTGSRQPGSTAAVEIAHPIFSPHRWPSYYGQVAFSSQFSWWSGSSPSAAGHRSG